MSSSQGPEARKTPRLPVQTTILFKPFPDTTRAVSVDVSKTGIRFHTHEPLRIAMQVKVGNMSDTYVGKLVWAKRTEDGGMTYGFEYEKDSNIPPGLRLDG